MHAKNSQIWTADSATWTYVNVRHLDSSDTRQSHWFCSKNTGEAGDTNNLIRNCWSVNTQSRRREGSTLTTSAHWKFWKLALANCDDTRFFFKIEPTFYIVKAPAWFPTFKPQTKFVPSLLLVMTTSPTVVVYFQINYVQNLTSLNVTFSKTR